MINSMDNQYINIVKNILKRGYYSNNRTNEPTYKLPHQIMYFNLENEFPLLQTKKVAIKTAIKEIIWIMKGNNNINNLGSHIWDKWADKHGSIGKAYGYQIKKYNQINNLIKTLRNNSQDRRMMLNMWNWEDLPQMNLAPCCFLTMWDVTDGYLNCMLIQRSGDMPLGVPFNSSQYAILTLILAKITNLKPGLFTHVINNAHIYENQIDGIKEQIKKYDLLKEMEIPKLNRETLKKKYKNIENIESYLDILFSDVKISINDDVKEFIDFSLDKINIEYKSLNKIEMPISV